MIPFCEMEFPPSARLIMGFSQAFIWHCCLYSKAPKASYRCARRTRTSDLKGMGLASYQLLHRTMFVFFVSTLQIYGKDFEIPNFRKTFFVEREVGLKPTTFRLEIWHSNQLNYSRKWSGKRDSDARPQPWQGCALTNWATSAYSLIYKYKQLLKSSSFQLCKYMEKFR